ncbi:Rieske 2Fe-2S domain-containing protein [Geodermatophilus sp. SYSU D01186]
MDSDHLGLEYRTLRRDSVFSPAVHDQELPAVFGDSWLYVGHESEVPDNGSYVTRRMGDDEVILCRSTTGELRVMLNSCSHRGTQLCRADLGTTSVFRCMYHGWAYDTNGNLRGMPGLRQHYPRDLDRGAHGLTQARVSAFCGLVFATWAQDGPSLEDYLGDMAFYLEALFGRGSAGWETVGEPLRWRTTCNWKLSVENFGMDSLHVDGLHASAGKLGIFGPAGAVPTAYSVVTRGGHGIAATKLPSDGEPSYPGYPEDLWPEFAGSGTPAQRWFVSDNIVCKGNVFPNFSFIDLVHHHTGDPDAPPVAATMLRLAQPLGPFATEVWMWVLVPRGVSPTWRRWSQESLVRTLGVSGTFEPDDLENAASVSSVNRGTRVRKKDFLFLAGSHLEPRSVVEGHELPGAVYVAPVNTEVLQRAFLAEWARRVPVAAGDVR